MLHATLKVEHIFVKNIPGVKPLEGEG